MSKKVLVVASHPDDEVLGCGGTIARHTEKGDIVNTIFLSDGVSSREKEINLNKKLRQESAKKAGLILGTAAPIFCDYPDNLFDTIPLLRIVKTIEEVVKEIKPEIVYTHHYGDLNIDHQITHRAVMTACRPLPGASVKKIISFEILSSSGYFDAKSGNVFIPNYFVDISSTRDKKIKALEAYGSEILKFPHSRSFDSVISLMSYRGSSVGINAAEAFLINRFLV